MEIKKSFPVVLEHDVMMMNHILETDFKSQTHDHDSYIAK